MKLLPEHLREFTTVLRPGCDSGTIPKGILIQMVYNSAHHVEWPTARESCLETVPDTVLRTLLTYAYLTHLYGSEDLQIAAKEDPIICYLCANHVPDLAKVRSFRRRNFPALAKALAWILEQVKCRCIEPCGENFDPYEEAARRIARAAQADSIALDV
jgi:hypothetical protein